MVNDIRKVVINEKYVGDRVKWDVQPQIVWRENEGEDDCKIMI